MAIGYNPQPDVLSLEQLVRTFNLQSVRPGNALLDKLETTAENLKTYKYDGKEFARLFAAQKLDPLPMLQRRANSKALSEKLSFALLQNPSKLHNAYARTFLCANYVVSENGRYKSKYCHNRWCLTCGRIKTAHYINEYKPILDAFKDKRFVTLTHKNPTGPNLKSCLAQMGSDWRKITDLARKQKRGLKGVRKLECTYNRDQNTYHPHFHIVVEGEENAKWIVQRWIDLDPVNRSPLAQDEKPATDGSLKELFKYFTKLTTNSSKDPAITIPAINHIFETIKGKRVFQSFGFVKPKPFVPDIDSPEFDQTMNEVRELRLAVREFTDALPYEKPTAYFWDPQIANWVNHNDGDTLTTYKPTEKLINFEKLFLYETGNTINRNWSNHGGNKSTNRRFNRVCEKLAERDPGPPANLEPVKIAHNVCERPPGN